MSDDSSLTNEIIDNLDCNCTDCDCTDCDCTDCDCTDCDYTDCDCTDCGNGCCCFKLLEGPPGPPGPPGSMADTASCLCVAQMRNVIEQLIKYYPTDNIDISMESGNNVSGRPGSLFPPPDSNLNAGLFLLINSAGVVQEAVSICRIAAIKITSAKYNDNITYLQAPTPLPEGCDANLESSIQQYLPVNTNVSIKSGGETVGNGTVLKSEYGMVVLTQNNNPIFISTCKAEIFTK